MDWIGIAAVTTALLGGAATVVVAVATLVATLRGNRGIDRVERATNGRMDELLDAVRLGAHAQGVEEGRRLEALRRPRPAADDHQGDGTVPPP